jgi:predicted dehydrogenase
MDSVRFVQIGTGKRGRDWYSFLGQMPRDVTLVAVCDVSEEAVQRAAAATGARPYTDYREMLDKERPEAAAIIVPEITRDRIVMDVLDARVHVINETPIAGTLAQADRQAALAERRGVKYEVAEQYYRAPRVRLQLELIKAGVFGKVHVTQTEHVGHGYHGTSLIRAFLDFDYCPARVSGFRRTYPVQAHKWHGIRGEMVRTSETWNTATFEFPGGELGLFTFTSLSYNSPIRFRDSPLQEHDELTQVDSARTTRFYAEKGMASGDEMVVLEGHETRRKIRVTRRTHEVEGRETLAALVADTSPEVVWENPVRHYPFGEGQITMASEVWALCRAIRENTPVEYGAARARLDQEMMLGFALSADAGGAAVAFPLGAEHLETRIPHH